MEHLEIERKYEAEPGFELPDLRPVAVPGDVTAPELRVLEATYYDTADLALYRNKVTLRRRTGGPDEGWHLKLPVNVDTRRELHEPLGDDTHPTVPGRLADVVEHLTAGAELNPIAILSTERTVLTLTTPAGAARAEVADDNVTARRLPDGEAISWREIEVETADRELLAAAGQALTAAGARPSDSASKLGRLLGLSALICEFRRFSEPVLIVRCGSQATMNQPSNWAYQAQNRHRGRLRGTRIRRNDEWACRRWRTRARLAPPVPVPSGPTVPRCGCWW